MLVHSRIERIDTFIARTADDIKRDDSVTRAAADALIAVVSDPDKVSRIVDGIYHDLGGDQKMQNYANGQPAELNVFNESIALAVDSAILAETETSADPAVTAQKEGILRAARVFRDVPDPAYPVHPFGAAEPAFEPKFYGPGKPLSDGMEDDEAIVKLYEEAPTSRIDTGRRIFGDLWDGTSRKPALAFMLAPLTEDGKPSSRAFFDRPLVGVIRTKQARVNLDAALRSLGSILGGPVLVNPVDMTKAAFLRMLLVHSGLLDPLDRATTTNLEAPPANNFENAVLRVGYDLLLKARPVAKFGGKSLGDLAYSAYRDDDDRKVPAIGGEDPTLESLLNDAEGKAQASANETATTDPTQLIATILSRFVAGDAAALHLAQTYTASTGHRGFVIDVPESLWKPKAHVTSPHHGIDAISFVALISGEGLSVDKKLRGEYEKLPKTDQGEQGWGKWFGSFF
jgi:hypothetical protein